ncbi:HNH endonuclease, partial [candidate division KSB1 bacterium]|nr:HNH endonuclease [candidate division KSB1 bacterium]
KDPKHNAKEKAKAKALRKTQWWRNRIAKGICYYCNQSFPPDQLTMDHIVPISRGGRSNKGNIVACCKECNNKKHYLTPVDMILQSAKEKED